MIFMFTAITFEPVNPLLLTLFHILSTSQLNNVIAAAMPTFRSYTVVNQEKVIEDETIYTTCKR